MPDGLKTRPLTAEEKAHGVVAHVPAGQLAIEDVSDKRVEKMARGFILGSQAIGRRREVKAVLEDRVTKRIGHKGKYLVDKLFELIDGVYVVDKISADYEGREKKGTQVRYYKVPPNLQAIIYALDRVLGKPVAKVEKSETKQGLITVEHMIKNMAANPYRNDNDNTGNRQGTSQNNPGGLNDPGDQGGEPRLSGE